MTVIFKLKYILWTLLASGALTFNKHILCYVFINNVNSFIYEIIYLLYGLINLRYMYISQLNINIAYINHAWSCCMLHKLCFKIVFYLEECALKSFATEWFVLFLYGILINRVNYRFDLRTIYLLHIKYSWSTEINFLFVHAWNIMKYYITVMVAIYNILFIQCMYHVHTICTLSCHYRIQYLPVESTISCGLISKYYISRTVM